MPNVYVEARPKGRPEGSSIEDFVWKITPTTCSTPSKRRKRRSTGPGRTAIRPLSRVCGT